MNNSIFLYRTITNNVHNYIKHKCSHITSVADFGGKTLIQSMVYGTYYKQNIFIISFVVSEKERVSKLGPSSSCLRSVQAPHTGMRAWYDLIFFS